MCGIAGFLSAGTGADTLRAVSGSMAATIAHRGPDDSGVWIDENAGIALAHRRLSIVDLSPAGHQPMVSTSGRFVLIFNGEIYNHLELREKLAARMFINWRGHSDTETLLACIDSWGLTRTLEESNGMFAIALWDRESKELFLARDRAGEKPLYYGWQGDCFLFGSELKALRAHPSFNAPVDRGALALLLRHNYIPAPYSIHRGIYKLQAGCFLKVTQWDREPEPISYWSMRQIAELGSANPFSGTDAEAIEETKRLLERSISRQMIADVPLGALLSGGIDSSLVTSIMQSQNSTRIRTFTIGFDDKSFDESAYANSIARHLGTDHTEAKLSALDALNLIPSIPSMYDEPFADSSQLPTHLVMRLARQHVTVAISGDAGDEFFGGYNRYLVGPELWRRIAWLPHSLRKTLGVMLTAVSPQKIDYLAQNLGKNARFSQIGDKVHKLGRSLQNVRNLDDLYISLVTEWTDAESLAVSALIPPYLLDGKMDWPELQQPVERMMALDAMTYMTDDILVKVDRAAMSVSLETRAPFLDRDLMEFAWRLPVSMKIRNGQGKWILRQILDQHIPRELIERPKMGFGIPLDQWLRGPLKDWADDLLSEDRLRREGYLEPMRIQKVWQAHLRSEGSFGYKLWSVLMFQAWLQEWQGSR